MSWPGRPVAGRARAAAGTRWSRQCPRPINRCPGAVIEAAVNAVAPGGQALRQLADALAADPGALAAGAPPVAGRLAAELIARGSATLAVPACTVCGRAGKPLFRGDGGGVCQRCRAWQVARPCASCGKVKPAAGFDEDGKAVCEVCRRRDDPRRHRECGTCGKTAPVAVRGRDGQPGICTGCYQLPEATCRTCQRRRPCAWAATSQPICRSCSLLVGQTSSNRSKTTPVSSENVKPIAAEHEAPVARPGQRLVLRRERLHELRRRPLGTVQHQQAELVGQLRGVAEREGRHERPVVAAVRDVRRPHRVDCPLVGGGDARGRHPRQCCRGGAGPSAAGTSAHAC